MLEVQRYLRSGKAPEQLKEEFGIDHKKHGKYPKLISFKYDQIDSHMYRREQIVKECRGLILDRGMNWKIVAHPFNKFFNFGEHFADEIDWDSAVVQEKCDGSLISLYYYNNEWHVATSGTPDAGGNVGLSDKTFNDLFWETFSNQIGWKYVTRILHRLPTNITFMFELCTMENRIVVRHLNPKIVLLGARDLSTGQELRPGEVVHYFPNTEIPKVFPVVSPKDAFEFLDKMNGEEQEGFVVCDGQFHRVKMKCENYVALHHLTNNLLSMRLIIDNVVKKGEVDEVAAVFPEYEELLNEARDKYEKLISNLEIIYKDIEHISDQKEFALSIKEVKCSGALFALRAGKTPSIRDFVQNQLRTENLLQLLGYK